MKERLPHIGWDPSHVCKFLDVYFATNNRSDRLKKVGSPAKDHRFRTLDINFDKADVGAALLVPNIIQTPDGHIIRRSVSASAASELRPTSSGTYSVNVSVALPSACAKICALTWPDRSMFCFNRCAVSGLARRRRRCLAGPRALACAMPTGQGSLRARRWQDIIAGKQQNFSLGQSNRPIAGS